MGNNIIKKNDIDINFDFRLTLSEGFYYTRHEGGLIQRLESNLSKDEIILTLNKTVTTDISSFFIPDFGTMPLIRKSVGFVGTCDIERLFYWNGDKFILLWDSYKALIEKE